jgi:hypothetical protein
MKIRVTVTHVLDFPEEAEFVSGPNGFNGIKLAGVYVAPHLCYLQTSDISSDRFEELSENTRDQVAAALIEEKINMARQE